MDSGVSENKIDEVTFGNEVTNQDKVDERSRPKEVHSRNVVNCSESAICDICCRPAEPDDRESVSNFTHMK